MLAQAATHVAAQCYPNGPVKLIVPLTAGAAADTAARAKPGDVTWGLLGIGSSTHSAAKYLNQAAGMRTMRMPYTGGPEVNQDAMAGRIGFAMASLSTALGQIKVGKLLALGAAGPTRADGAPDIPTTAEQGHPNFGMQLWFGSWSPARTPAAIVQRINADMRRAMQDAAFQSAFAEAGMQCQPMETAEFARFVRDEIQKFQKTAQDTGIDPQ